MEPQPKPTWLSRLEEESWQAELIISGAAIFGSLQLPGLVDQFGDYLLYTMNRESMVFWGFIMLFLKLFSYTLIGTFIFHFIMRTVWIGIIGINSAYPGGFKPNKKFSEDYQQKLNAEFGDVNEYIQRLDRSCSSIFGNGFTISMVAMGWATVMIVLGLIFYFLRDYLPPQTAFYVGIVVYFLVLALGVFGMVLGTERYKNSPLAHKYQFPLNVTMSKMMYQFAYRPINIMMNIVYSNVADKKGSGTKIFIGAIGIGIVSGMLGASANKSILSFDDDQYHRFGNDTTMVSMSSYADHDCDCLISNPVVPAREITQNRLFTVFIPLPNREFFELEKQCSIPEVTDYEDRDERRTKRRERIIQCAHEYIEIYLNGKKMSGYDLARKYFGNREQYGVEAVLIDAPFKRGKNWLKVVTQYLNEDQVPRETYTSVYYWPNEQRPNDVSQQLSTD